MLMHDNALRWRRKVKRQTFWFFFINLNENTYKIAIQFLAALYGSQSAFQYTLLDHSLHSTMSWILLFSTFQLREQWISKMWPVSCGHEVTLKGMGHLLSLRSKNFVVLTMTHLYYHLIIFPLEFISSYIKPERFLQLY
jgi:hypothetical protein